MKEKNEDMTGVQPMSPEDLPEVLRLERESFGQMAWTERDFRSAMASDYDYPMVLHARMSRTAMPEKERRQKTQEEKRCRKRMHPTFRPMLFCASLRRKRK